MSRIIVQYMYFSHLYVSCLSLSFQHQAVVLCRQLLKGYKLVTTKIDCKIELSNVALFQMQGDTVRAPSLFLMWPNPPQICSFHFYMQPIIIQEPETS